MNGLDVEHEINCPSSGMSLQPLSGKVSEIEVGLVSTFKSSIEADTFFSSSWEPPSLWQNENFVASSPSSACKFSTSHHPDLLENEGLRNVSHLDNDPSNLCYDMFGSWNFSEIAGSYGLVPEGGRIQISDIMCSLSNMPNLDAGRCGRASTNDAMARGDRVAGASPDGKRRKLALGSTSSSPNKNAEGNMNIEPTEDFSDDLTKEDRLPKADQRMYTDFPCKSDDKRIEENSQTVRAPSENYIHLRARRGQATNSHSLAERVRREKISERMKLLQELVPGCNQITGKAMMLDEIINYVQSLQQQVELLSMKLANIDPELNFGTQQILAAYLDSQLTPSLTVPHSAMQFRGAMPTVPIPSQQVSRRPNDDLFFGFQDDEHKVQLRPTGTNNWEGEIPITDVLIRKV